MLTSSLPSATRIKTLISPSSLAVGTNPKPFAALDAARLRVVPLASPLESGLSSRVTPWRSPAGSGTAESRLGLVADLERESEPVRRGAGCQPWPCWSPRAVRSLLEGANDTPGADWPVPGSASWLARAPIESGCRSVPVASESS